MLFPAPLSRRGLIGYKLFRAQIAVLINALIWVFVLRRGGTISCRRRCARSACGCCSRR